MATWVQGQWRRLTHRDQGDVEEPQDRVENATATVDAMAGSDHLGLLLQGVARWNSERPKQPELTDANLREANLDGANLSGARLSGANLREATLRRVNLSGAILNGANLSGANLLEADLSGAEMNGAKLMMSYAGTASLAGSKLYRADMRQMNLSRANLSGAEMVGANLVGANMRKANLIGADLTRALLIVAGEVVADFGEAVYDDSTRWPDGFEPPAGTIKQGGVDEPEHRVGEATATVDGSREVVDVNALIGALDDPDFSEARSAARALGETGDLQAVDPLVGALEGTDLDLRREAAAALASLGSARAVPALIVALTDSRTHPERSVPLQISASNADARIEAARALGEIGDVQAIDALESVKHLQHEGLYRGCTLAEAAEEALAKLGAPAAEVAGPISEDRLIEALLSPLSEERERAIEAVEQSGEERGESLDRAYQASCKVKEATHNHGGTDQRLVEEAIELAPTFSAAMDLLSNIYQYRHFSTSEALEWATKAVAADTSNWLAWIQLGRVYADKRDAVQATRAFAESIRLNPEVEGGLLSEPYSFLLPVYVKVGMREQATDAEKRVRDGGTRLSPDAERAWLASVTAAPVEALRDALTGR